MKTSPLVSIVVPVYNVEQYLNACLESLIMQTYENIEIICINDGSTDHSTDILDEYIDRDRRIQVVTQPNMGLSAARNTGMKHIHGKYTMFVDSDDWIDLETCEEAVRIAEAYSADLVFWSYVREFSGDSKEKYMFWNHKTVFDAQQVQEQLHKRVCGLDGDELRHPEYANAIETAWAKLYRTDILLDNHVQFVDTKEIGTEDALFNLYALGYVKRAVYLKRCFNHYRKNNQDSLTRKYNEKLFERWKTLFGYMKTYLDANELAAEYYVALNNRIALSLLGLGLNIVGSSLTLRRKLALLNQILEDPLYIAAYKKLDYSYFPIHWKLFYGSARFGCAWMIYVLLQVISYIISR